MEKSAEFKKENCVMWLADIGASPGGGGGTPDNGLYGKAPPERGTFFKLQVYKRVGISQVEVYKRVGQSVIKVFKRALYHNISNRRPLWLYQFSLFSTTWKREQDFLK